MSGGSGRRFGRAGGEGAHGRITQHVSILDAGPLLFDADAVHDVAVASSNAISSDVQLRCRCFKSDTLKIPFKERRTLVKKKRKGKDISLMKNQQMVWPSTLKQLNQGYKVPDVEKMPRPHVTNGWMLLSTEVFFFF